MAKAKIVKSPWSTSRDREAEREEKREAVLHAAAQAFAENGYHGTSLDSIAARLGVTKPTLYYYASSKDDLISLVVGRALEQIFQAIAGDDQASGLSQLKHLIRQYVAIHCTDLGRCLFAIRGANITGKTGEQVRDGIRAIDRRIRDLIEMGQADGSIGPCDVKLTAFMIAGAIKDVSSWFDESGPLSAATVAEKFANQMASGLEPRS